MADEGLNIRIGADVTQAVAGLDRVNTSLKKFSAGANQTRASMVNLSRVIQDAPFGIIGIANNIDPLINSFQQLSKESGGTGKALKSMAASMLGPAGLAIGISAITSLMVVAVQKYGSVSAAVSALFGGLTALAEAQRDVNKAMTEGQGKAAGEIATLQALLATARDSTLSRNAQQEALNKINKEYDKFLPKLTQENKDTQAVKIAVDKLTDSLVKQAQIKGLASVIEDITAKQAKIALQDYGEQASAIDHVTAGLKSLIHMGGTFTLELGKAGKKTGEETFKRLGEQIDITKAKMQELTNALATSGTLFTDTSKVKTPKAAKLSLEKPEVELKDPRFTIVGPIADLPFEIESKVQKETGAGKFRGSSALDSMKKSAEEARKMFTDLEERITALSDVITNTLGNAFTGLFEDIFSGSKNAFQAFGNAIAAIIKKLAAAAIAAAIFAMIISATTGGAGIPGGGAFMKIFKTQFGNLSGLGNIMGGIAAPSGGANVRGAAARGQGGIVASVAIRGQDLLLVFNRTSAQQGRLT